MQLTLSSARAVRSPPCSVCRHATADPSCIFLSIVARRCAGAPRLNVDGNFSCAPHEQTACVCIPARFGRGYRIRKRGIGTS
eukprot:11228225-Alexandrium_andersonii.AAC.1